MRPLLTLARRLASPSLAGRARAERPTGSGFTLFEVVVSLIVALLLVTAIVRAFGSAWLQAAASAETATASVLARSLLADMRTSTIGTPTTREGTSSTFHWRIVAEQVRLDPPPPPPPKAASVPANDPNAGQQPDQKDGQNEIKPMLLFHVTVDVAGPSGRHARIDGLVAETVKTQN